MKKKLKINILYSTLSQLLTRGGFVVASMILANSLTTSAFAEYSYFQLTINMLASYASLGISVASSRTFANIRSRTPPTGDELIALWVLPIATSFAMVVFICIDPLELTYQAGDISKLIFALAIGAVVLGSVSVGAINGLEMFRISMFVSIGNFIILFCGSTLAANHSSLHLAAAGLTVAVFFKFSAETLLIFNFARHLAKPTSPLNILKKVPAAFSIIGPSAIITLCSASAAWIIGRLVLSQSGSVQFSLYAIGLQWYAFALFIPGVISRVLFATQVRIAQSQKKGSRNERNKLLASGIKANLISSLLFFSIGAPFSPILIRLYSEEYSSGYLVIVAFLAAGVSFSITNVIGDVLIAENRQIQKMYATVAWLVLLVTLAYFTAGRGALIAATCFLVSGLFLASVFSLLVFGTPAKRQKCS